MLSKLAKKLEGRKTIKDICVQMGIRKQTAINYIYALRKAGYIQETRYTRPERTYVIKSYKKICAKKGLVELLNARLPSDFQISEPYEHYVWGEYPAEKALVDAVKTKKARFVLASLLLFRSAKNWSVLYRHATANRRKIGALYDLARREIPKVPRMDKRIYNALLNSPRESPYIIQRAGQSTDYADISKKWGVFVPFAKRDIGRIK